MIGLFFGSFNPIHAGHLIIARYMASFTGLTEVWLVVSPHNPLKTKSTLANAYDRLEMARLATENAANIRVSDIEFSLPQPSYTVDTLAYLTEKHPEKEFALIMGADNLVSLKKWKNYEVLLYFDKFEFILKNNDLTEACAETARIVGDFLTAE